MVSSPFWFGRLHPCKSIQSSSDHCYIMMKPFYTYGSGFLDDSTPINRTQVLPEWFDKNKNDVSPKLFIRSCWIDAFEGWTNDLHCSCTFPEPVKSRSTKHVLADHDTLQRLCFAFICHPYVHILSPREHTASNSSSRKKGYYGNRWMQQPTIAMLRH